MSANTKGSCSVCKHPERPAIDEALLRGDSLRAVAEAFGFSKSAVHTHSRRHVARDGEVAAAVSGEALIQRLERLELDARRILAKAERGGDYRSAIGAVREMRGVVDSIARITGAIRDRAAVNVHIELDEAASLKVAIVFLERRGWKLVPPPIEARALPTAEPEGGPDA